MREGSPRRPGGHLTSDDYIFRIERLLAPTGLRSAHGPPAVVVTDTGIMITFPLDRE
jgi:hypothetical protein